MGSLNPFKKASAGPAPTPAPVAAPPSTSDASVQNAAADELKKLKMQRGRASTILTAGGIMGDDSTSGGLATKMLLGG